MDSKRDEKPFNPPKPEPMVKKEDDAREQAAAFGQTGQVGKSSGRYLLRTQHVLAGDRLLEPGTEVGTDTGIDWPGPPTPNMEGMDDAGRGEVEKLHKELYNRFPPWDYRSNPEYAIHEERRKEQEHETESEPVSFAQAQERGKEKDWKGEVPQPITTTRTVSGDRSTISLPATNIEKPNEEQYPKG